jgi:hypothetical protein
MHEALNLLVINLTSPLPVIRRLADISWLKVSSAIRSALSVSFQKTGKTGDRRNVPFISN